MQLRTRLVLVYAGVFTASMVAVLATSYWLIAGHLRSTVGPGAEPILDQLVGRYALAILGATLLAVAIGGAAARALLAPLREVQATAEAIDGDRLDQRARVASGAGEEVRELGESFDAMLDRVQAGVEAQRRFIANASHELRSPLTAIRAEVDVTLSDPAAGADELREMGERVLEDADALDELLAALMTLARSQRELLRRDPIDVEAAVRRAADELLAIAQEREVSIDVQAPGGGAARVAGDPALVRRLAANLLDNAVRYNRPGGHVFVELHQTGGQLALRVENTGPPLSAADVARLADPFERLGRHGDGGSGLGLSIVRAVTEAHGGTLTLAARPGGGLVATAELPTASVRAGAVDAVHDRRALARPD